MQPAMLLMVLATVAVTLPSRNAHAAALFFSSPGPDAPGLVRVDMWFEDPSRETQLRFLQFDLDLVGVSSLAPGVRRPDTVRSDGAVPEPDELPRFPFDRYEFVGDPVGGQDVRLVVASEDLIWIDELALRVIAFPDCRGWACPLQEIGLDHDRIYLGSFNLQYDGNATFLKVGAVHSEGPQWVQLNADLRLAATRGPYCGDARGCQVAGLAPEPVVLGAMALVISLLGLVRGRGRVIVWHIPDVPPDSTPFGVINVDSLRVSRLRCELHAPC